MSIKVGVDIIQVARVRKALERRGERFLRRLLSEGERHELAGSKKAWRLASHWAAKEAVSKALCSGLLELGLRSIELRHREDGSPYIVLSGRARQVAERSCISAIEVTLSHDGEYVVAVVVAETGR